MTSMDNAKQFGECYEQYFGLYPGVASDVVDPDGKGRITVRLPWISGDYETRFAHVAQIYAGDGYGASWIPEEGDQVIVAFLKGQLSNPVVLGSIYSNARRPPVTRGSDGDPKILWTKAGHYLLMEDETGQRIELTDLTGNNSIVIDTEQNTVYVLADDKVVVEAGGDIEATAGGSISLSATSDISLSAQGSIEISASGEVSVSGATINLN